jgi:hypothetical protein
MKTVGPQQKTRIDCFFYFFVFIKGPKNCPVTEKMEKLKHAPDKNFSTNEYFLIST